MPQPCCTRHPARPHPHVRREGMVLIITLMIITVASATAAYALQGSAVEVQGAGAFNRRMRTKYATESLVMATATLIDETAFCTPGVGAAPPNMTRYRLPAVLATDPSLPGGVSEGDFNTDNTRATPLPAEQVLRSPMGAPGDRVYPYEPYFAGVKERWVRADSAAGAGTSSWRCAVTIFGELNVDGRPFETDGRTPDIFQTNDVRRYHDAISMSQAYYDFTL